MNVTELLQQHYATGLPEEHLELLNRLSQYCGKSFFIHAIPTVEAVNVLGQNTSATTLVYEEDVDDDDDDVEESAYQWTFYNALLFVIITISTIGEISTYLSEMLSNNHNFHFVANTICFCKEY